MSEPKRKEKDKKLEPTPEEQQRQKFRAKCRFRALARRVIDNTYWLAEFVDDYEGDNVKRRVEQVIRKSKRKQLLNINDKSLLNKPAEERTEQEQKYLYRIIGGLKCFKRYPDKLRDDRLGSTWDLTTFYEHVKRKLAAVTYFKYYGPDRVIVRQNQEAYATYFIVTGDINISLLIYDEYIKQQVSVIVGQMHPGDMFGEVSLLHNIKRTATCTTVGHCEFLALMKEDFKNVLLVSLQRQWDQIRHAMSSFSYFNSYDEVALREGCIVAKMKSFSRNETIMGDGRGTPTFVYFVLSGRCQMIESLQIRVTTNIHGKKFYSLYDPFVRTSDNDIDFDQKCLNHTIRMRRQAQSADDVSEPSKNTTTVDNISERSTALNPKSSGSKLSDNTDTENATPTTSNLSSELITQRTSVQEHQLLHFDKSNGEPRTSIKDDATPKVDMASNQLITNDISGQRTVFMQVCEFLPGAVFGLGENMRDRRIIALTDVDCMLLPYVWLMQRNTVNIWSRVKHYLSMKIPTKQKLFKEFVNDRHWDGYRDTLLQEFGYTSLLVQGKGNQTNITTISDIPYSIRVKDMLDF